MFLKKTFITEKAKAWGAVLPTHSDHLLHSTMSHTYPHPSAANVLVHIGNGLCTTVPGTARAHPKPLQTADKDLKPVDRSHTSFHYRERQLKSKQSKNFFRGPKICAVLI